jgi:hypothetical protein
MATGRRLNRDEVEALLRRADARIEDWSLGAQQALGTAAGVLRRQVDELEKGLRKLSVSLGNLETSRTGKSRPRTSAAGKPRARVRSTSRRRSTRKAA